MSETRIIERNFLVGGDTIESRKIREYESYLVVQLRSSLERAGFGEKFPKYSKSISEARTIQDFDKLADEWEIPRLNFEIK